MKALAAALAGLVACSAIAQGQAPATEPQAATTPKVQAQAPALIAATLAEDIDTASFYELVAWCRELGLDDTGSRADLQDRLRKHYGVEPGPVSRPTKKTVSVTSAREAEYFTIEQADESYFVLRGDVVIELRDEENDAIHEIRAQTLTFNQTRDVVSAEGGVRYTLRRGDRVESFEGQTLQFDLKSWEGVFTEGRTSKTQKVGDNEVSFSFQGSSVTRLADDTVLLEGGDFTSCDDPQPHYVVRAKKAWILAPGEWALQDAVLFIGSVPVLWLPFFFLPGDHLVFNPSFGYRTREGSYIQTTTYLIGRRKQEEGLFSFLKLSEATDAYRQELRGLFLRKLPAARGAAAEDNRALKLLLDAYTRLGLFAGLAGTFPPFGSFTLGIARSRSLFLDPVTGLYSAIWTLPDGSTTSYWNTADLLGLSLPLRYGLEGQFSASSDVSSVNARFELYSDPSFTQDFLSRTEGMQLTQTLELPKTAPAAEKPTLVWELTSRHDLTRPLGIPTVQSFAISSLGARFLWQSRDATVTPGTPAAADPGSTFYYPSTLTAPFVSANITGELLRISSDRPASSAPGGGPQAPPAPGPGKGLRAFEPAAELPAPTGAPEAAQLPGAETGRLDPRQPSPLPDSAAEAPAPGPTLSVTYQITPRATLEDTFDASGWKSRQDIDMGLLYGTFETAGTERLSASASLAERRLDVAASLAADSLWRRRFDPSATLAQSAWLGLLQRDLQQDRTDLTATLALGARPFAPATALGGSSISWRIGLRLFQLRWAGGDPLNPQFVPRALDFTKDTVSEHSLQSTFALRIGATTETLSLAAILPPLASSLSGSLESVALPLRLRFQAGAQSVGGLWQAQPIAGVLTVQPSPALSLAEELQLDAQAQALSRSTTTLKAGGFSAAFSAERRQPVSPIGVPTGAPASFLPSTFSLSWDSATPPLWSWQDRVRLEAGLRTGWSMNLQRYTDNLLEFAPRLTLSVRDFLDLSFSSLSVNTKTYRYVPGLPEALGETWVNPLVDLARSYNFFDVQDRYRSAFKIRSLKLSAVHHLHDWDLSLEYQGAPQLKTYPDGHRNYEWGSTFSIQLKWIAVPEVQNRIRYDNSSGLAIRG